ncbi:acyltransferase [Mucilaginibacter sp.]|uniref:acyltransferase family protein n=1 Tax=Mucilaginibacter sp. TaxID=1882438 RepID=UPI003266498F
MQPPKRYLELDALRGMAAIFVVLYHFTLGQDVWWRFNLGVTGVDLFFIISGFVIFMSINNVASGTEFVINRICRLYPTYWVCVSITFGVMVLLRLIHFGAAHDSHAGLIDYLANLTMFQYYLGIKDLDIPYWTMIVEMLFYIVILILYSAKMLKHIIVIGCFVNVFIILNGLCLILHWPHINPKYFPLFNHFALFFSGITFYKLATGSISRIKGYTLLLFCIFIQCSIFLFAGPAHEHISWYQYIAMLLFYFLLFTLFINDWLKFIVSKPALFLGKISFALYLIHSYVFVGAIGVLTKHGMPFCVAVFLIAVPGAIVLAWLITVYIERPLGKKLKAVLNKQIG